MRTLVLALLFSTTLALSPTEAPPGAAQLCDTIPCLEPQFIALRDDIITYVLGPQRRSLTDRVRQAQRTIPTDPCRSTRLLYSADDRVRRLGLAGQISVIGVATIRSDIKTILEALPEEPCVPQNSI